eukprot:9501810-Pyramimonas_sp.AAC.1
MAAAPVRSSKVADSQRYRSMSVGCCLETFAFERTTAREFFKQCGKWSGRRASRKYWTYEEP